MIGKPLLLLYDEAKKLKPEETVWILHNTQIQGDNVTMQFNVNTMQMIYIAQKEPEMTVTIGNAPNAFPQLLTELR